MQTTHRGEPVGIVDGAAGRLVISKPEAETSVEVSLRVPQVCSTEARFALVQPVIPENAGLAWFEVMPSKRRRRREAPVTSRHRAEGINDTVPNRLDHVGSGRPGK